MQAVLDLNSHSVCGKKVKCKRKLLKSQIDQIRPFEKSKYGQTPNANSKKRNSKKSKTSGKSKMTENNVRYSPHQEYCRKKKPYLQYAPPPLGDIQRPLDPRVTAFREQGQARR